VIEANSLLHGQPDLIRDGRRDDLRRISSAATAHEVELMLCQPEGRWDRE
jgi:hypothetical protein